MGDNAGNMFRTRFKQQIVAEFLPPLRPRKTQKVIVLCDGMPSIPRKQPLMEFRAGKGFWVVYPRYRGAWESEYILCPATGMRIAAALALNIDEHISPDCAVIQVRQQVKGNKIARCLKTDAAYRDIDLCPEVAELLKTYIGNRSGLLFLSKTGKTPMSYSNVRRRSLHPKLVRLGLYTTGAATHCFRRLRSAVLKKYGCPDDLRKFWLGHEKRDISDEYAEQLLEAVQRRQAVATAVGLGFEVPKPSFVPNVPKTPKSPEVEIVA
jgi:integrase